MITPFLIYRLIYILLRKIYCVGLSKNVKGYLRPAFARNNATRLQDFLSLISGEIAGKMGSILQIMGNDMQVIALTHLPQIAGKGKNHYLVYKKTDFDTTRSLIKKMNNQERITEIAKMLSDETITDAAIKTAKELLDH